MVIWCDMVCLALALAPSCAALHFWCLYIMLSKSYLPRRCDWKDGVFYKSPYIIWWKLITSNEEFTSANMDSWNPIFHPCRHKGLAPCPEVNKCRWSISLKKTDRQGEMINLTHGLNTKSWTHRLKHSNKICSQDALFQFCPIWEWNNETKLRIRWRLWKQPSLPWLSSKMTSP